MRVERQLDELEKDVDREKQKSKEGHLALETLKKWAEEDRVKAEEEREKDKQEKEEIKRREEDRVQYVEGKWRLEVNKEREITELKERPEREKEEVENRAKPNSSGSEIYYGGPKKTELERENARRSVGVMKETKKEKPTRPSLLLPLPPPQQPSRPTRENASTPTPNADGPPFSPQPFQPIPYLPMPPPPGMPMPAPVVPSVSTTPPRTTPALGMVRTMERIGSIRRRRRIHG